MDISLILGVVIGIVLIVNAIGMADIGNFIDRASILITVGGTVAAVIATFPLKTLAGMGTHIMIMLKGNAYKPEKVITQIVDMAQVARRDGLLALEEQANDIKDPFFKRGILLVVDAMDAEKVRTNLEEEIAAMDARHDAGANIYEKAGAYAPAFGMIGTLVGLINMLRSMDLSEGSSSSLGENMSVAMVTTFYGCVLANLFFNPMAKKLRLRNDEEIVYRQIIVEGVLGILNGENPKNLKEKLVSYMSQKQQIKYMNASEKGGKGGGAGEAPQG